MSESVRDMLAREADEAEARADAEERGDAPPTPGHRARRSSADPAQVYAVRFRSPGSRSCASWPTSWASRRQR